MESLSKRPSDEAWSAVSMSRDIAGDIAAYTTPGIPEPPEAARRLVEIPIVQVATAPMTTDFPGPGPADTDLEASLAYWLRILGPRTGLPPYRRNFQFHPGRGWMADFAWPDHMVMVECEGYDHRRSHRYATDLEKYNAAAAAGWTLLRVTTQMLQEEPESFIELLRTALDRENPNA